MTKTERCYFSSARAVSQLSDHTYKIGAIVIDKHRIISSGFNSNTRTHPLQALYNKARFECEAQAKCHAELSALIPLIKYNRDLSNSTMYIYREHKDGSTALARPCKSCMKMLKDYHIKKIYYTTEDGFAKEYINY